jgi:hypothetical protein
MARWINMSTKQFVDAFHAGERKGKITWPFYGLQVCTGILAANAIYASSAAYEHRLDSRHASLFLIWTLICALVVAFCLVLRLRASELERAKALKPAIASIVFGVIVLCVCANR